MKKIISLIFSALLLIQNISSTFAFNDIKPGNKLYEEITYLEENYLLPQEFGSKFEPDKEITLGEFYAMLISFAQVETSESEETSKKHQN